MLKILIVADFSLQKTGILSTAMGLISPLSRDTYELFSDQDISINGVRSKAAELGGIAGEDVIIFTHLEYSRLPTLSQALPNAFIHVGDWPGNYWMSLIRSGRKLKGMLGLIRFRFRLQRFAKQLKLVFVSMEDQRSAICSGFLNARYLPIGINIPDDGYAAAIGSRVICFSGNFRYEPNRLAAISLLDHFRDNITFKIILVGYFANDLRSFADQSVELHEDVPSVVDFLTQRRPIYVSLLTIGAGAKNKILEAIISGCPIVCTEPSLDLSIADLPSIIKVESAEQVIAACERIGSNLCEWNEMTLDVAKSISEKRSWNSMSRLMREQTSSNDKIG